MTKIVEIVGSVSSIFILKLFVDRFFYQKDHKSQKGIIFYISGFVCLLITINLFLPIVALKAIIVIAGAIGFCLLFYDISCFQAIFTSVSYEVIAAVVEIIEMGILSLSGIDPQLLMRDVPTRAFYIITTQILLLILVLLTGVFSEKKNETLKIKWILPLLPCQILSVMICYISFLHERFDAYTIILLIVLLYLNIAFVYYVEMIRKSEEKRRYAELAEQQYEMQKEYYQRLHENQEETRALWHDIQKYVLAMQAVANMHDNQPAQSIIRKAEETLNDIGLVVDVDNLVVSSILNAYLQEAKNEAINVKMDVQIPQVLPISPVDLSIVLGNTLDNAIEACHVLPLTERWIKIKLYVHNQTMFYQICNPYGNQGKSHLRGKYHGYGLSNVRQCVLRYDGDIQIADKKDTFEVTIRMNCFS